MAMSQPRQHVALDEFFRWETESWVEVVADMATDEKAYFMPLEELKAYWAADNCQNLNNLLTELFQPHYPPIDAEFILREHTAVFCVLLRIGQGVLIEHFARYEELSDPRLPFDPEHPPRGFPIVEEEPDFLNKFCERQWAYCVPIFDDHFLHKHFGHQRLLPIVYKEPKGIEGLAGKYMIQLYGPHNEMLSVGRQTSFDNANIDTFLLKRFPTKEGEADYKREVNGFRSLKHVDSIIRYYGSYIHGDDCNILLEYADKGSLEDYFQNESPPSRGVDIIKFWENLLQLIKGLRAIHSVREAHQNVTPDQIFVVSNGAKAPSEWHFKFADFGLEPRNEHQKDLSHDMQDEFPYAAPEFYKPCVEAELEQGAPKITWAIDIWSLGCIFSEAAMWIADGFKGVVEYRKQRMAETDRILFRRSDGFHDGERVLQSVLDCHKDIEDRLRRSDYITKDILDSMVDEMLWEDNRPNAKALIRKADMITAKARNKLSGDQFPRSRSSSQGHSLPLYAPPNIPLPPIPKGLKSGLASIAERQYPPNVEKWRLHVNGPHTNGSPISAIDFAKIPRAFKTAASTVGSVSDLDRELNGSIASWQLGDNNSMTSPITPFTSPTVSVHYDQKQAPNEGRPRIMRSSSNNSGELRRSLAPLSYARSTVSNNDAIASTGVTSSPSIRSSVHTDAYTHEQEPVAKQETALVQEIEPKRRSVIGDLRGVARAASRASSKHSSNVSTSTRHSIHQDFVLSPDPVLPAKSQKRSGGFSLFPPQAREASPPQSSPDVEETFKKDLTNVDQICSVASTPRSAPPLPSNASILSSSAFDTSPNMDFLSLDTCLEWKKAHKKVKKHSKIPPLPGASGIEPLNGRDHVFIVDDSASMGAVWPEVNRVFEALSYVVKGMSPDGTELYFTISYDTWRRKDTFDLVEYLEKKRTAGETNITHRLDLQLQTYRARLYNARSAKGKKAIVRPMSIYVLTNGEWGPGKDPKIKIKEMADFLIASKMTKGQVIIEFVSFAQNLSALQKISDLATTDFGVEIVGFESAKGNVLKMLRGPLDNVLPGSAATSTIGSSRPVSVAQTMSSGHVRSVSVLSELA